MNANDLKATFPHAAASFLRRNLGTGVCPERARPAAKLEPDSSDGTLGQVQIQAGTGQRFLVRVESFRHRLLDEDGLCEKYIVDLCRYAGVLPSDAPGTTKIEVAQQKVGSKEPEFVRVQVYRIINHPEPIHSCD